MVSRGVGSELSDRTGFYARFYWWGRNISNARMVIRTVMEDEPMMSRY